MDRFFVNFLVISLFTSPLSAQKLNGEAKVLKSLCQYENVNLAHHISPYFLSKLPAKKLVGILSSLKKDEGACVTIEKIDQHNFLYTTERSQRAMQLYLDKKDRIRGLWFGNATAFSDKLFVVVEQLKKLSGTTSLSLTKNGKIEILSHNASKPLAVDSSSSLLLLHLLQERVQKTKLNWNSVVKLTRKNKSFPDSKLYKWPEKAPVTIQTLATMVMANSDDTANDHLFKIVGRKRLEKVSKENRPFLSTHEYYKLRGTQVEDYAKLTRKKKRQLLAKVVKIPWRDSILVDKPFHVSSIGWFLSTKELCDYMYKIRKLSFTSVNSGLAQRDGWDYSAFKMGRAPGVLQYTHLLKPKKSKDFYCLSITWNHKSEELETSKLDSIVGRILSKIK